MKITVLANALLALALNSNTPACATAQTGSGGIGGFEADPQSCWTVVTRTPVIKIVDAYACSCTKSPSVSIHSTGLTISTAGSGSSSSGSGNGGPTVPCQKYTAFIPGGTDRVAGGSEHTVPEAPGSITIVTYECNKSGCWSFLFISGSGPKCKAVAENDGGFVPNWTASEHCDDLPPTPQP